MTANVANARQKFLAAVLQQVGKTVLMGKLDCSELVAIGVKAAGGEDQSQTHWSQRYFDESRALLPAERPVVGDLGFYGTAPDKVSHVIIFIEPGRVLSADGATSRITTLEDARKARAEVRMHRDEKYRTDVPFLGWRRHTQLDDLDKVTR